MEGAMSLRHRHRRGCAAALAMVVAAGLALTACGGGGDTVRSGGGSGNGNGGTERNGGDAAAQAYVGLTKKDAIAKAEADGRKWRITRENATEYAVTFDYDPERLNFEIDNGKVTKATFG